ncbi:MAG: hypothetical protein FWE41_04725 [Coriobacteriia bacterium]|nr:hypothetical protein [Coriobacteriia bacterium]MCL2750867.1 hypothetical protein [Coriobacteriia bacterium]
MSLIIVLIMVPTFIGVGCLGVLLGKKLVMRNPVIIAGYTKKSRVVIHDERLKPAFWKMQKWFSWFLLAATCVPVLAVFAALDSNWPLVVGVMAVGAIVVAVLFAVWRRNVANFHRLKNEWGVVQYIDETVVRGEVTAQQKKMLPLFVILAVTFSLNTALQMKSGNLYLGIFCALMAVYTLGYTIFIAAKKKQS